MPEQRRERQPEQRRDRRPEQRGDRQPEQKRERQPEQRRGEAPGVRKPKPNREQLSNPEEKKTFEETNFSVKINQSEGDEKW